MAAQMYPLAFKTFRRSLVVFLAVAAILTVFEALALNLFSSSRTTTGGAFVAYSIVALISHRMVLLDEHVSWTSGKGDRELRFGRFIFAYLGIVFTGFAVFLSLVLAIRPALDGLGPWVGQEQTFAAALLAAPLALLVFGVVMALIGTVLPAIAIGADASLGAAFSRGRQRFWRSLWRLATGSLVYGGLTSALLIWLAFRLPDVLGASLPIELAYAFLADLSGLFCVYLVAVAVSIGYLEAGGEVPVKSTA